MTCVSMKIVVDDCSDVLQDLNWLRSRAADNGYLYFPRLLPADKILRLCCSRL